jgi:regulator of RNase E activity RraA
MIETPDISRPPREWSDALQAIGTATISSSLQRLGVRNSHLVGPQQRHDGRSAAGPALTLQFMPKREDVYGDDEYDRPELQLHRHVLYHTQPGDMVVVDARGDLKSGIFGEMMLTYFKGKGGVGCIIDGCVRDFPHVKQIDIGLWTTGLTPNFHAQTDIMPFAVNGPIACGNALVMPGDIVVADDDGAVVVPVSLAQQVIAIGAEHHDWEEFAKLRLEQGGDLRRYYPLSDAAQPEYEAWQAANARK